MSVSHTRSILTLKLRFEQDIVLARQRARQIAGLLGFEAQVQTHIATATSEIARNAFVYGGGGTVEFLVEGVVRPQTLLIRIGDRGPGIEDLSAVLEGQHTSGKGMGLGLLGARRLMDRFHMESVSGGGTTVELGKILPARVPVVSGADLVQIADQLASFAPQSSFEEVQQQNRELLRTLEELRQRQEDLIQLNHELDDTNRGMVALYTELDEKNRRLEEASRLKSQFLANMSHELRTPLNSIIGFTGIILQGIVGTLNDEQHKQLNMVYNSAKHLLGLINDILDLSKIEAGKIEIIPAEFEVREVMWTVEKMVSPMIEQKGLLLKTEISEEVPSYLYSDRNRIRQVLINLLSNAAKFTEEGQIVVSCRVAEQGDLVVFGVQDTGVGIQPEFLESIFDEFTQIEGPLKEKPMGTGLGLAISKKIVEMMGGSIGVESQYGQGSHFHFTIPAQRAPAPSRPPALGPEVLDPTKKRILTVEDQMEAQEILKTYLHSEGYEVIQACNALEAMQLARKYHPFAITLDILMPGKDGWDILRELKQDPQTEHLPVICISILDNRDLGLSLGAVEFLVKPVEKEQLIKELRRLEHRGAPIHDVLIIDDDPQAVEVLAQYIGEADAYTIRRAYGGQEGLTMVEERRPDLILLDLTMPEVDGFEVIRQLKRSQETKDIPIVIVSGKTLTQEEIGYLNHHIQRVIEKGNFTREELLRDIKRALEKLGE